MKFKLKMNAIQCFLPAVPVAALLAWVYYPAFVWMADRWTAPDSYYGHGILIPAVTAYWLYKKHAALAAAARNGFGWGILFLAAGGALQAVSGMLQIYFLSALSFVIVLFGIIWVLFGRETAKLVWFPVFFLWLMVPLPLLVIAEITLKMKFFISDLAAVCLNLAGVESVRHGSYIVTPNAYLLVGDPCSGLRSFLAFLCLGFVFAYGSRMRAWGRIVLIAAGLPIAIFSNLIRVFALGMIAEIYGMEAAGGAVHDASGFVTFVIGFIFFMMLRGWLEGLHAKRV